MNRRKQVEVLSRLVDMANNVELKRYRLLIICGEPSSGKSQIARAVSEQLPAHYVDITTDLIPQIITSDSLPTLGAYGPSNLVEWILRETEQMGERFLIIDQIEPLLATFGQAQAIRLFQMVGQIEPRKPVILVTYLDKQIEKAAFPVERILYL